MAEERVQRMRSVVRRVLGALCKVVFVALFIEFSIFLYVQLFPWPYSVPSYSWTNAVSSFWVDRDSSFGVWHEPHSTYRHTRSCFTVDYRANDYGARDRERQRTAPTPRTVVLGDSFIEGYGVREVDRLSNRLEQSTGIEHLNFGTSGNFGPLQYRLLYETLASKFSHDRVIVGLLPRNDFSDDYGKAGKDVTRYRPYYRKTGPSWEIVYTGRKPGGAVQIHVGKGILREFTHIYHVARAVRDMIVHQYTDVANGKRLAPSKFHHYTERELEVLYLSLDAIREQARKLNADVVVVLIPAVEDFFEFDPARGSPLGEELGRWARRSQASVVDLLPLMYRSDWSEIVPYFLTCDRHWSPHGNAVAARIVMERVYTHPTMRPTK